MNLTVAWLAQGKVRIKVGEEPPRTVESRFGRAIRERAVQIQQRHGWKAQGDGEKFLAGAMLWGRVAKDPAAIPVMVTSLCRGARAGELLYSLETDDLCAILALDNLGEEERRLWNKNDKRLSQLCVGPDGAVACSVRHPFGTANIGVKLDAESGFAEVTEGDSFDAAPQWVPGSGRRLIYQSAGFGRNREGQIAGQGPFGIQLLDIDRGELTTVAEDPAHDLLTPQITGDGTCYYIRRPYRTGREFSLLRLLKDVVFFPFRLVYAVFQWLQFFSLRYTGRKLTTDAGARAREADLRQMMIWGNTVAAQRAGKQGEAAPGLVPDSWQLVRRSPSGQETVLARGVLAYDRAPDGSVVYTNGSALYLIDPEGQTKRVLVESMIEQVVVVNSGGPSTAEFEKGEVVP